jgi:hypothetical protein
MEYICTITYRKVDYMIIGNDRDLLGESGIIMNINDQMIMWDTETILMKDRDTDSALFHY